MIQINSEKICCISDIHIGVHQNNIFWHTTTLEWSCWLRDRLREQGIKDIIICGDLFHYRDEISVNTLHVANNVLKNLKEFNIIMLVGNHDAYYKDRSDVNSLSILDGWSNITVISQPSRINIFNKELGIVPWGVELKHIPECDILFGHFEIETFKMNAHKICDHGIKTSELLKKATLIISGHFHLREERKYDNKTILYLGNPFQMDFGDVDSTKGFYILDIPNTRYTFFENNFSPTHKKVYLSQVTDSNNKLFENVENDVKNNLTRLVVDKNISNDEIDIILSKLNMYKPLNLTVDYTANFNKYNVNDTGECDFTGIDIPKAIEEFVNLLDIKNKQEVIKYGLELYNKYK